MPRRSPRASSITQATRPTLADVHLAPRRRLRDGSTSTSRSSSSRGSSLSRGRSSRLPPSTRRRLDASESPLSDIPDYHNNHAFPINSPSLSPPPPAPARAPIRARPIINDITERDHLEMIRNLDALRPGVYPIRDTDTSSLSSAGEGSSGSGGARPRYTRAEKGKGRAVKSVEVDDVGDESIQLIGIKRKGDAITDDHIQTPGRTGVEEAVVKEVETVVDLRDDLEGIEEYTCPVCFCEPKNAVATICGHVLCSGCLQSSLLAAIARNPNALATTYPLTGRGRGRGRGRNRTRNRTRPSQPIEWTNDTLTTLISDQREESFQSRMRDLGLAEEAWDLAREQDVVSSEVKVEQVLKGLWKVDGSWIIEGECPVCRNPIPGGYAPFSMGVTSVIPISTLVRA